MIILTYIISCSKDGNASMNHLDIEKESYYGTYLFKDSNCSGYDIQYLTIDESGISFFDYLGDFCDDTVNCYSAKSFELMKSSIDTILNISIENDEMSNGFIHIVSDSSILVSYVGINDSVEHSWEKIKDKIYSFTPLCDQEYVNTKDLVDMMVYAVDDEGDLLWESYLHEGIWEVGNSVTPLSDGGYIVFGLFDAVNWGGCCYTKNAGMRDIVKLNSQGQEQWRKQINYEDYSTLTYWPYTDIGKSLIQTSQGDLVVIIPGLDHIMNVVMMDTSGSVIWSQNLPELYSWSGHNEILETEYGNLAVIGGTYATFLLLDYYSGNILEQKEYEGLRYAKAIISVDGDFAILGLVNDPESFSNRPLYLQKVSSEGDQIWLKTWEDDTTKPRQAMDLIRTSDHGYLLFCNTDPPPNATLIKTDSEGNEEWRKKYNDYTGGEGWIHKTEDGGYFMASVYAVTKLDSNGDIQWSAASSADSFLKYFNNGIVVGANRDMRKIDGGAIFTGYGSSKDR